MDNLSLKELYSKKHMNFSRVNSLLKISFGLVLFTMISFVFVYGYTETISLDVEGTLFDVEYDVIGMTISGIEADTDFYSLILTVDVTESTGVLNITLDRSFFDSTYKGLDEDFIILAEGDESPFSETATSSQSRTLSIELPAGTKEIEIFGSEFGVSIPDAVPNTSENDAAAQAATDAAAQAATDAATQAATDAAAQAATDAATQAATDAAAQAATDAAAQAATDTSSTRCGPGTILQNGACVLDERCGPGTTLKDGTCVLDSTSQSSSPSNTSIKEHGKDLVLGLMVAFVGAGIVGIVFALISKANKSS